MIIQPKQLLKGSKKLNKIDQEMWLTRIENSTSNQKTQWAMTLKNPKAINHTDK